MGGEGRGGEGGGRREGEREIRRVEEDHVNRKLEGRGKRGGGVRWRTRVWEGEELWMRGLRVKSGRRSHGEGCRGK